MGVPPPRKADQGLLHRVAHRVPHNAGLGQRDPETKRIHAERIPTSRPQPRQRRCAGEGRDGDDWPQDAKRCSTTITSSALATSSTPRRSSLRSSRPIWPSTPTVRPRPAVLTRQSPGAISRGPRAPTHTRKWRNWQTRRIQEPARDRFRLVAQGFSAFPWTLSRVPDTNAIGSPIIASKVP